MKAAGWGWPEYDGDGLEACMAGEHTSVLWGVGIYSLAEAARLTGVHPKRIRRWLHGYSYESSGERHDLRPVWESQLPTIDEKVAIGFLDLMEVRFVKAFLDRGVSLQSVRKAASRAKMLFGVDHALCTNQFVTDGRTILVEVGEEAGEKELLDLVRNQYAFRRVLRPYLHGVEFHEHTIARWWPLGDRKQVVVDPDRSFGAPITADKGVPTAIIAQAVKREGSIDLVARWYQISKKEIRDALQFESSLAA